MVGAYITNIVPYVQNFVYTITMWITENTALEFEQKTPFQALGGGKKIFTGYTTKDMLFLSTILFLQPTIL